MEDHFTCSPRWFEQRSAWRWSGLHKENLCHQKVKQELKPIQHHRKIRHHNLTAAHSHSSPQNNIFFNASTSASRSHLNKQLNHVEHSVSSRGVQQPRVQGTFNYPIHSSPGVTFTEKGVAIIKAFFSNGYFIFLS